MFGSLFLKECKMWLKSILFYAYVIILLLFYISQMGSESVISEPKPSEDYGFTYSTDQKIIMNGTLKILLEEYCSGKYKTYPIAFCKEVTLSAKKTIEVETAIKELTKVTADECKQKIIEYYKDTSGRLVWPIAIAEDVTYEQFLSIMTKVSKVVGKGCYYEKGKLQQNAKVPVTYDEAQQQYQDILQKDRVTGAYARLFSDYLGIMLAIIPAFFGVARVIKDKKSKALEVQYVKKASSFIVVSARGTAMITMQLLPVLFISCFSLAESVYIYCEGIGSTA